MCPVTQQGLGNACGACASIHVVEHIWGASFAPKQSDVSKVWQAVRFDQQQAQALKQANLGDGTESDPFKIANWLKKNHNIQCTLFVKDNTKVAGLLGLLWGGAAQGTTSGDGLDVNNLGKAKCAIGIYLCTGGLHYLALYKKGNEYWFIDSNYQSPSWQKTSSPTSITGFSQTVYTYAGGSINIT